MSHPARKSHPVRTVSEAVVCLALAVILFRAFEVEGYVISTGSMAPGLYGYHKRVVCPNCTHAFARGVAFDDDGEPIRADESDDAHAARAEVARCPNCGQGGISLAGVPDNQGDQLLVLKHVFELRDPRRWEVVVFRHPDDARQAYVKRVVGLPGEAVRVWGGDVYADGVLARKSPAARRAVRLLVHDADEPPTGPHALPRWSGEAWGMHDAAAVGDAAGRTFLLAEPPAADGRFAWLTYRHRLTSGGTHRTAVTLDRVPRALRYRTPRLPRAYGWDADTRTLSAAGVLPDGDAAELLAMGRDPAWRWAVERLAANSRLAPVDDSGGYNRGRGGEPPEPVRDFLVACTADLSADPAASLAAEVTDGRTRFRLTADRGRGLLELAELLDLAPGGGTGSAPLVRRSVPLPAAFAAGPVELELSLFDRSAAVTVGGRSPFAAYEVDDGSLADHTAAPESPFPPADPVRVGGAGGAVRVSNLKLYRDVHYTRGRARHGVTEDYRLDAGELFVLGDNSPVSLDSRGWADGAVPTRLLVGKPFVVHLPSRPGRLNFAGRETTVRVPDPSRIRYIH